MASIEDNKRIWGQEWDWTKSRQGEAWSAPWGSSRMQWYAMLLPRIYAFLPARTVVEIGAGFGRWSAFLQSSADRLILVDLAENCIEACRQRFSGAEHVECHVNDGQSLDMVSDGTIDFAFSFDSLVHAEEDAVAGYVRSLAAKLAPDGVAFVHHSNLGEYGHYYPTLARFRRGRRFLIKWRLIPKWSGRGLRMSAGRMRSMLDEVGLHCLSQELINWVPIPHRRNHLIDCITVFARPQSRWRRDTREWRNSHFDRSVADVSQLARLYDVG